jgi:hypothetical protein
VSVFATPIDVSDVSACFFYHTMDLPGVGVVHGEWDLRDSFDEYIGGGVGVRGKRVLDVGAASGFVTFSLEQRGAWSSPTTSRPENNGTSFPTGAGLTMPTRGNGDCCASG